MQTVGGGMQFVREIGAVGLWVVCGWNWCGEPSQALRASSPGGRAKGAVGIDGWWRAKGLVGIDGWWERQGWGGEKPGGDERYFLTEF
ncbi:MAG: hypothetical protein II272_09285 [Oscillospiraceae bacterium]|nr:hypothetical protein [Oscillospiraceae bacterium]